MDTPAFKLVATDTAIHHAQLIIIPLRPSPIDFEHFEAGGTLADVDSKQMRLALEQSGRAA